MLISIFCVYIEIIFLIRFEIRSKASINLEMIFKGKKLAWDDWKSNKSLQNIVVTQQ